MHQVIKQTEEERFKMYMKLTRAELVRMLMINQDLLEKFSPTQVFPYTPMPVFKKTIFADICHCNPKNGGSGICGCVMGNLEVSDPNVYTYTSNQTTDK